jgi:hypothetical protein
LIRKTTKFCYLLFRSGKRAFNTNLQLNKQKKSRLVFKRGCPCAGSGKPIVANVAANYVPSIWSKNVQTHISTARLADAAFSSAATKETQPQIATAAFGRRRFQNTLFVIKRIEKENSLHGENE